MDHPMRLDRVGRELIKSFESLSLTPYQDEKGIWTIGWGHTEGVVEKSPAITKQEADELFAEDVAIFERSVSQQVTINLSQHEFNALVSLVFNIGEIAFRKSTLLQKLNGGDKRGTAKEFDRWVYVGTRKSDGLRRRREKEKSLFLNALAAGASDN